MPSEGVIEKLKKGRKDYETLFAAGDLEKIMGLYDPEAVIVEKGIRSIYGKEAIIAFNKEMLKQCTGDSEMIAQEFYGDDDYPVVKGTSSSRGEAHGDKIIFNYTVVFRRHGESYLLWHDEFSQQHVKQ